MTLLNFTLSNWGVGILDRVDKQLSDVSAFIRHDTRHFGAISSTTTIQSKIDDISTIRNEDHS